jgi:hypothetical protein
LPAYPWYIEHSTYVILTHLSMVFCSPLDYKWGASTYHRSSIYNTGGRFSIRGLNIPWIKIYPSDENTMGVRIRYVCSNIMNEHTISVYINFIISQE